MLRQPIAILFLVLCLWAALGEAVQTKCRPSQTGGASASTSVASPGDATGSSSNAGEVGNPGNSDTAPATDAGSMQAGSSNIPPASSSNSGVSQDAGSQLPASDQSSSQPPTTDQSASPPPTTDQSASPPPTTEQSASQPPSTDQSASQAPATDRSASQAPSTDQSASQAPATDQSASQVPVTDASASAVSPGTYVLDDNWAGETFFNGWDFFDGADPTHGSVTYVSQSDATSQNLAYVTPSGQVVMRADNTTTGNRKSVRISTQKTYNGGLFVLDLAHLPTGVGTWPAWWTFGPNWPNSGEIDILEGVSTSKSNQYTLHTGSQNGGCTMSFGDCYGNMGCDVIDPRPASFGDALNQAGGGVFVMSWTSDAIQMWFFDRNSIPQDLSSGDHPNPSSWSTPAAIFPNSATCNIKNNFKDHQMIINLTFCGDWAGAVVPDCVNQVTNNPSQYSEAYWLINSVKTYQQAT